MNVIDANLLFGNYPFRKLTNSRFDDFCTHLKNNNVIKAYISSINSVFYRDPMQGEEDLHKQCKGIQWIDQIMTVNPLIEGFDDDISYAIENYNIKGIKLLPGYHGYSLDDTRLNKLFNITKSKSLPMFLTMGLEDDRLSYLFVQKRPGSDEMVNFLKIHHDLKILILYIKLSEIKAISKEVVLSRNVYIDTSGLREHLFDLENAVELLGVNQIVFGSSYPINYFKSISLLLDKAELSNANKERIATKNIREFMC